MWVLVWWLGRDPRAGAPLRGSPLHTPGMAGVSSQAKPMSRLTGWTWSGHRAGPWPLVVNMLVLNLAQFEQSSRKSGSFFVSVLKP